MQKILLLLSLFFSLLAPVVAQNSLGPDVIYLKNGSVVYGYIIELIPEQKLKLKQNLSDADVEVYLMEHVDRIVRSVQTDYPRAKYQKTHIGYKGFVDAGVTIGTGLNEMTRIEFNTSHGYQISPAFFLGAGTGVHVYIDQSTAVIPIFLEMRGTVPTQSRFAPFLTVRGGYSFMASDGLYEMGWYLAPAAGLKVKVNDRTAWNISLGYTAQWFHFDYDGYYININEYVNLGGVSLKLGFEF